MLYASALAIVLLLNTLLAILVLLKNYRNHINIAFFIFASAIVLWIGSNYLSNQTVEYEAAFLLNKLIFIFSIYIVFGLFYFSLVFPTNTLKLTFPKILMIWSIFLVSNILTVMNQVITGVSFLPEGGTGVTFGFGIFYFAGVFIIFLIASIVILIRKLFKSTGYNRLQIQYLLLGISVLMIFGTITNLIIPLFYNNFYISNIGPFFSIAVVGFTTYAIVRHRLMDIRFVIARSIAYSLLVFCLALIYSVGLFSVQTFLVRENTKLDQLVLSTGLALIIAFTFQPLRRFLEKITDKVFFKDHYNSDGLLKSLSEIMSTIINLKELTTKLLNKIINDMRLTRGAFVLLSTKNPNQIEGVEYLGFDHVPNFNQQDIAALLETSQILVLDDLEEGSVKELMRNLDIFVSLPLKVDRQKIGFLFLGEKSAGDVYSQQDIKMLEILAPQLSLAIQHSKEYDEISKFNITLQQEIQKATQDLQNANNRLKELDHLKDDFVSVASHELRTPMTAIRSYVWMALHKPDMPLSEKLKRYLYRTLVSTERLINLVNDMLNVSRIEAGKIEIYPKPFDIVSLVKDVMEEVKAKADEKLIKLQVLEQKLPAIFADPDKVHQILLNLIGNALKFTPPDGIISVGFFTDGNMVEISVKDTGAGISKEDLAKLFHKFSRLDNSYVAMGTSGGTGLGLYISKSLIDLMHGRIWAASEGENKGSTFTFSLPIATQELINEAEKFHIKPKGEVKVLEPVTI